MSFGEKCAWIFLAATALVTACFFVHFPWSLRPPSGPSMAHALLNCIATLALIYGILPAFAIAQIINLSARTYFYRRGD